MKYYRAKAGEWIYPVRKGYKLRCCDCGLIHDVDFGLVPNLRGRGQVIRMRFYRNERATAASRRWLKRRGK